MVPALFVANYIIEYSNNMGDEMNNLKLQKLLYFINARFLVEENRSLFEENFEKWKFGPVIPSVYHEYKSCGAFGISSENIVREFYEIQFNNDNEFMEVSTKEYDPKEICSCDRKKIGETIDKLKSYGPFELVELTHSQSIWSRDREKIDNGERGIQYSNWEIKEYFKNNIDAQIWR